MKRIPLLIFLSVFLASCATMDLDKLEKHGSGSMLADLTEDTTLAADGIFYEVKDPSGTPLDRKVTSAEIAEYVLSTFTEDVDYQGVLSEGPFVDGDKTDHDAVVLLVDQDVTSGSAPTLLGTNFTLIPAGALATTQDWSGLAITFPPIPMLTLEISELGDGSNPYLLTAAECKWPYTFSNSEAGGAIELDFPAAFEGMNLFVVEEAGYAITLDPNGTETWYFRRSDQLAYTQLAAGEAIVVSAYGVARIHSSENRVYVDGNVHSDAASTTVDLNLFYKAIVFDPASVCDGDENIIFIADVDDGFGSGLKIYKWVVEMTQDPATEIDFDLMRADDYISETNSAVVDALDTTAGESSETTEANINGDAIIANGSVIYGKFGTSYEDTGEQVTLRIWGWWK